MNKSLMHRQIVVFFISLIFGPNVAAQTDLIKYILQSTQKQYVPDRRIAVYDISYKLTETCVVIVGEVDNPTVKNAVINSLRKNIKREIVDSIQILPSPSLGDYTNGIVVSSVGNIWRKPAKKGRLATQALMGTEVKLLKKRNEYFYIRTPDKYLGWIDARTLYVTDQGGMEIWHAAHKVIVTKMKGVIYKNPETKSIKVSEVVAGCILKSSMGINGWTSVELADGRKGFIIDSAIQDLDDWKSTRMLTGENLEKTAITFLGVPYLWGGISVKGMDCSGFVKTVYWLNGMELDRDADQQVKQGTHIDPGKDFKDLRKGDLLFFGQKGVGKQIERITHVGLYLENRLFIHSPGRVRLSSFDSSSKYFDQLLLERFIRAKRLF